MKKLLSLILALAMVLALVACGSAATAVPSTSSPINFTIGRATRPCAAASTRH